MKYSSKEKWTLNFLRNKQRMKGSWWMEFLITEIADQLHRYDPWHFDLVQKDIHDFKEFIFYRHFVFIWHRLERKEKNSLLPTAVLSPYP